MILDLIIEHLDVIIPALIAIITTILSIIASHKLKNTELTIDQENTEKNSLSNREIQFRDDLLKAIEVERKRADSLYELLKVKDEEVKELKERIDKLQRQLYTLMAANSGLDIDDIIGDIPDNR